MQGSDAMKSFGKYISKYLLSFIVLVFILVVFNIISFVWTFHSAISKNFGDASPKNMLEKVVSASSADGIEKEMTGELQDNHIWAMFLNSEGDCLWSVDLPMEFPTKYSIQDVAVFSKGYLKDYPVFVWNDEDGLLVLGYPKDSYTKINSNYYSIDMIRRIPVFFMGILVIDLLILFIVYSFSKSSITKNTGPIITSIQTLSDGKPATLSVNGELSEIANSINKASFILSRQNEARANWISGVSHDIRTPLSMIMGYAERIVNDKTTSIQVREQADIVYQQSRKIKDLVQDLNLVSRLEYEMQPLHKENVRLSKVLRSYAVDLLNGGLADCFSIEVNIAHVAENIFMECDVRLITRAISNLVQNSIRHNPDGCKITTCLDYTDHKLILTVADNGVGLSAEKLLELKTNSHYMENLDERLNLKHGLGLILVRQILEAHHGTMEIESEPKNGYETKIRFSL